MGNPSKGVMETFTVSIQVIKTYHLEIEALTEDDVIQMVSDLHSTEIEEDGSLEYSTVDYAEVV